MNLAFSQPWLLLLLPLCLLPYFSSLFERQATPTIALITADTVTIWLNRLIHLFAAMAIGSIILGLAGIHLLEQTVTRTGSGAHIVFVLDRSASMNETFGGETPDEDEQSKAKAARRILSNFVTNRPHDLFGVAGFSTQPFYISPLTEHKTAIQAAINSMETPGLAFTNVAKGLGMGLSYFKAQPHTGSRVIVLVSDGAATLDHRAQKTLREWFERYRVSLYWFFLRTENGQGIYSEPESNRDDNPRVMPERYLHKFFNSLSVPYHAYEVDTPESLQAAIHELDELESLPLVYQEKIPRQPLAPVFYFIALLCTLLLVAVKSLEKKA
ncbi:MxaC protein [Methylophaga thiooxydans]|uniref:von Willebrand factor type A domain protein n=2 Tax=Methylophaga thiooxydans TaxID=392484 RepID=C0N5U2_9GAMM|nr:vWA domain-containing protein [Methylophaga thiooxydans]EEF79879.1 von Willebrand factor type A domain protein [Methylophaga thiooxydans DMS010]KGM08004.1 MxaC protein [Methylophaga thiooxydans]